MRVLVLGGGGREHALCWALAQSDTVQDLRCAPGNAGIAQQAQCVALNPDDPEAVTAYCQEQAIDLLVVGPEAPLAAGVSDAARAAGIDVFGPSKAAAALEVSKAFAKDVCIQSGAPTAAYAAFDAVEEAEAYLREQGAPMVVKADGLAAGKGVVVAEDMETALRSLHDVFDGPGGGSVVLEEKMTGPEVSFFVLTDGQAAMPLAAAQDHKRAFDGDKGPNTGGMGAYSPAPVFTDDMQSDVMAKIVEPVLAEMRKRATPYAGILYVGLMLTPEGPKVVEFNARFGDPECQCILPRLSSDLLPLLVACARGTLAEVEPPVLSDDASMTVVLAAKGYPGSYAKGEVISGFEGAGEIEGATVFHAGTKADAGSILSNGGRVLAVTATGEDLKSAKERAYSAVKEIDWKGGFYREDIGWRAL